MLKAIHPLFPDQSMKNKFHRLIKKLEIEPPTPVALQSVLSNETSPSF